MSFAAASFAAACERAREYVKTGNLPSAVLTAAGPRETFAGRAFGPDGEERPELADRIFVLASITKTFAGTGAARLLDQGRLDFTDPIRKFIPEFNRHEWRAKVRVGDIFTHTTGLQGPDMTPLQNDPTLNAANSYTPFLDCDFEYEPDTRMSYRTGTYQLFNEIVRRLTGKPMSRFLANEIYAPAGLKDTGFHPPETPRLMPVVDHPCRTPAELRRFAELEFSGAGLASSARDLVAYAQALLEPGRLLSPAAFARMTAPQPSRPHLNDAGRSGRTWGWNREPQAAFPRQPESGFYHGGATGTLLWIDPEREFIFVFLTNRWGCSNDQAFACLNCFYE